jgi:hypothetical protein
MTCLELKLLQPDDWMITVVARCRGIFHVISSGLQVMLIHSQKIWF